MPGAEAVDGRAEPEVPVHLEGREADVDPVQVGDHVEQEQERDEPPLHFRDGGDGRMIDDGHGPP